MKRPGTVLLLAALACGPGEQAWITGCDAVGNARPLCGFPTPEDLALLPDGHSVMVSEYGSMAGDRPGGLALLDLRTDARRELFRGTQASPASWSWGDPACPGPPPTEFSPHGIDLAQRSDGRLQLLVVQHAGRESIEFFEVLEHGGSWAVAWRGCAVAPDDAWFNDVVALPDGGFLVTHMISRSRGMGRLTAAHDAGEVTGWVYEWQPDGGFSKVRGTESPVPNGIAVSPDGQTIYLNVSGIDEVWRISRAGGEVEARAHVRGSDNSSWGPDGRLLIASRIGASSAVQKCVGLEKGACPVEFAIVALDPVSMETEVIYRNAGPPMGAGTVGLIVGDELLVGSFSGDRILRVRLDPA